MAIPDSKKVDYLWKKLGYGATKTDTNAVKKAPNEAIASPLLLRGDKVWQQASEIPTVMPGSSTAVVTVYPTSGPRECTVDGTATANRTWKSGLTDWIPPEIGSTYQLKIYVHTAGDSAGASGGDQLFATGSGNDDEWFFDYQSGVVHFIGSNLPNGINFSGKSVYISGARYTGTFGVGGASSSLGDITAEGTTLTTPTNDDLILDPQGTGIVVINTTSSMKLPYGTTGQRPTAPEEGEIRYNSTLDYVEVYKNGAWVRVGDPDLATITHDEFDGDGSTVAFTLSTDTASTNTVIVTLNGVIQEPTNAYTVSGSTLTFTSAPSNADHVSVRIFDSVTSLDKIQDADADTKIEVERTSDDDTVRITVAGTDRITVTSTATTISGLTHNVQNITGPGAISLTETVTLLTTTGTNAYTLANGTEGQIKIISMKVDGGNATVTPTSFVNGTQIVFNDVEDTVTMLYQSTGWVLLARQNATVS